tara:strand:+ start:774 stop:989 length:216 start_codon:yes stop_codon:yes gene_type:complete
MENNKENKTQQDILDNPIFNNIIENITTKLVRRYSLILLMPVIILLLILIINILQLYIVLTRIPVPASLLP